jgi:hypothetical protein
MLAVLSLYSVDFSINAGEIPPIQLGLVFEFTDPEFCSYVLREKLGCRHATHPEATDGGCLG